MQVGKSEETGECLVPFRPQHSAQVRIEREVLHDGEILIEAKLLRHIADEVTNNPSLISRIVSLDRDAALGRQQQSGNQTQQRGLTRTVRPDQAGHPAAPDGRVDGIQCRIRGSRKKLGHPRHFDRDLAHKRRSQSRRFRSDASIRTVTGMPWRKPSSGSSTTTRKR